MLYQKAIILITIFNLLDSHVLDNIKYFAYFKNCLKILCSTYLLLYLLSILTLPYYN